MFIKRVKFNPWQHNIHFVYWFVNNRFIMSVNGVVGKLCCVQFFLSFNILRIDKTDEQDLPLLWLYLILLLRLYFSLMTLAIVRVPTKNKNFYQNHFSLWFAAPWIFLEHIRTFSSNALWCSNKLFRAFSTSTSLETPLCAAAWRFTTVIRNDRSCLETRHSKCSNSNWKD